MKFLNKYFSNMKMQVSRSLNEDLEKFCKTP